MAPSLAGKTTLSDIHLSDGRSHEELPVQNAAETVHKTHGVGCAATA